MLDGIKRWLHGAAEPVPRGLTDVAAWADGQQHLFRAVADDGFVVDGRLAGGPGAHGTTGAVWRLEWGPSQRPYFTGNELRLRAEPGIETELQLLLLTRPLQEQLEKSIFEQYVEDVQTRIDTQTPPEMRWLVMFPKLLASEMGPLRDHYVALGNARPWLLAWLDGPLTQALQSCADQSGSPMALMIGRGRLTLRMALNGPRVIEITRCVALFEAAMREARRVHVDNPEGLPPGSASDWGSTTAS